MTQVIVLAIVAVVLLVVGIVLGKIGSNKGITSLIVAGFFLGFIGVICGYLGYDSYMLMPTDYSISSMRKTNSGYQLTLSGATNGITSGQIVISIDEAKTLHLMEEDEDGNWKWVGGTITESRRWVTDHREN